MPPAEPQEPTIPPVPTPEAPMSQGLESPAADVSEETHALQEPTPAQDPSTPGRARPGAPNGGSARLVDNDLGGPFGRSSGL
jgi:hypothetical protein